MHRLNGGDDRHMRAHHLHQRLDFSRMVHADLEDRKPGRRRATRQRQRHAPVIVEGRNRCMGLALRAEHRAQRFLGRGLADRSGHRDDFSAEPGPCRAAEVPQPGEHIVHHEQPRIRGELVRMRLRDHGEPRAVLQRRLNEIVPVVYVALDGEVSLARRQCAAIDRDAGDRIGQCAARRGLHRLRHRRACPQWRAHAACSASAAMAAS